MRTASSVSARPSPPRVGAADWAIRTTIRLVVLLLLFALAIYTYPWLVSYGVLG